VTVDRLDMAVLVFLAGVFLAFVGLWLMSPALALMVAGLFLVFLALTYTRIISRKP
jgi:hypothetical protein